MLSPLKREADVGKRQKGGPRPMPRGHKSCAGWLLTEQSSFATYHPDGWLWDGIRMADVVNFRPKTESEKITINLGFVDLGHIDLLVEEGFYSNRTDFIRTAIRNLYDRHIDTVKQSVERRHLELGLRVYSRQDLEAVRAAGKSLHIQVLGLAVIDPEVSPELASATIASIEVLGALQASAEVKLALSGRMR